jgi:hypothetical protein
MEVISPLLKDRNDLNVAFSVVCIYGGDGNEAASSLAAAKVLIAASYQDPDKALALWSKLPNINKGCSLDDALALAKEVGLDVEKIKTDMTAAQRTLEENGQLAISLGIPLRLPVTFVDTNEGTKMIPPFVKEKMNEVLDKNKNGEPWDSIYAQAIVEGGVPSDAVAQVASQIGEAPGAN